MHRFGDPLRTRDIVTDYCRRLLSEGCSVALVPFCRNDLEMAQSMRRSLGASVRLIDFWAPPIGEALDVFLAELSQLQFVVAERLHAAVLAAAMDVPFVALPYKPKCLDFVTSLKTDADLSLDYARLTADELWRRTREALIRHQDATAPIADSVRAFRKVLRDTAVEIEDLVLGMSDAHQAVRRSDLNFYLS
jgi:polysaccharide pyruvyl transferase WcaK-like protein